MLDLPMPIYNYVIVYRDDDTHEIKIDHLVAYDDEHAKEEAWYECGTDIIAVQRKEFMYWQ